MKGEGPVAPPIEVGWVDTCRWLESATQCRRFGKAAPRMSTEVRSPMRWSRVRCQPRSGHSFGGQKIESNLDIRLTCAEPQEQDA